MENIVQALSKWHPRFHGDAFSLQSGNSLLFLLERVVLNMIGLRHHFIEQPQIYRTGKNFEV